MFTKNDLKNGDVIVRRNGDVEIAIVDLGVFVCRDGWNNFDEVLVDLTDFDNDSEFDIMKVIRPTKKYHCRFDLLEDDMGEVVYKREEETKPLYNGKAVCIDTVFDSNAKLYTIGKIYTFKDGQLITDTGCKIPTRPIHSFEEWSKFSDSKWIEIKE